VDTGQSWIMQIKSNALDGRPFPLISIDAYPNRAYGGSEGGFAPLRSWKMT